MLRRPARHAGEHDRRLDASSAKRKAEFIALLARSPTRSADGAGERRRRCTRASTALLEALGEAGVSSSSPISAATIPALIEAIAEARADGRTIPQVITCPNEMVALSCRPRLRPGERPGAGRARACRVRHAGARRRRPQRRARARAGLHLRRHVALHPGGRAHRQPQRVHPVDPGRRRPARHRPRIHEIRQRDPHRRATSSRSSTARCSSPTATPRARSMSSARAR